AAAALALPFALPAAFAVPPAGEAYLWLMELLAVAIGLPFFAVSANAPLLQAWFARTDSPHAADPYFLYAASNCGSLLALVAYPVLIEPALGLAAQSTLWSVGFGILGAMIAGCGILRLRFPASAGEASPSAASAASDRAVTWPLRMAWVALAFVPSGLVVA